MNMKDGIGRNITERLFTENKSNMEKKHHQNHENLIKKMFGDTASEVLF